MTDTLVTREDFGPIAVLTLNRPASRNALSRALVAELGDRLDAMAAEPMLRVVIVAANGPTFCAGMDLKEAAAEPRSPGAEQVAINDTRAIADMIDRLHKFPRPTIAAVQGDALAGGAGLALACDFVLMAGEASIAFPEVKRGLVAAIIMHDLVRHVGDRRARDLLLTGRAISSAEAESWGLINRAVGEAASVRDEAMILARILLTSAPMAVTTTKRLLNEAARVPTDLRGAAAISGAVRVSEEAGEGMAAFFAKRKAAWDVDQ